MIIFETTRLIVRRYRESDTENFFLLNGDETVTRYIRPAKNREECNAFLEENLRYCNEHPLYGRWAVDDKASGLFVGSFAIIPVPGQEQMQLGYALLPGHWGRGFATELSLGGLHYVFTKTPIDPIYAYTQTPNAASQNVLTKAGFRYIGDTVENGKEISGFLLTKEEYLELANGSQPAANRNSD